MKLENVNAAIALAMIVLAGGLLLFSLILIAAVVVDWL